MPSTSLTQTNPGMPAQNTVDQSPITTDAIPVASLTYPIVDTGQGKCYNNTVEVHGPQVSAGFYG